MGKFIKVAQTKDLSQGKVMGIEIEGKRIALFHVNDQFYAIEDECSHASGPLSEGTLDGTVVTCPWHGAGFDITNGQPTCAPAHDSVKSYNIQIDGDDIKIEI